MYYIFMYYHTKKRFKNVSKIYIYYIIIINDQILYLNHVLLHTRQD